MAFVMAIFFVASAGASSAYLTVSEIFPMETRALLDRGSANRRELGRRVGARYWGPGRDPTND